MFLLVSLTNWLLCFAHRPANSRDLPSPRLYFLRFHFHSGQRAKVFFPLSREKFFHSFLSQTLFFLSWALASASKTSQELIRKSQLHWASLCMYFSVSSCLLNDITWMAENTVPQEATAEPFECSVENLREWFVRDLSLMLEWGKCLPIMGTLLLNDKVLIYHSVT